MRTYYVGMDVHSASTSIVVLNGAGKVVKEAVIQTQAAEFRSFFKGLRGNVRVTFEEGTQASWLHDVVAPLVSELIVCNPRNNKYVGRGNKSDRVDALKLAELLRGGMLQPVYHGERGLRTLKELARTYRYLVVDATRLMNRLKALYRGRGISCAGRDIYRPSRRAHWLQQLSDRGLRYRAASLYRQLENAQTLRREAKAELLREARRYPAHKLLCTIPQLGPVRVVLLLAVVETPFRFRSKRQFWAYAGLAVVTRDSAEYVVVKGSLQKRKRAPETRGLNRNYNRMLKQIFKGAAASASAAGPFRKTFERLVAEGLDESVARVVVARKLAATTLSLWKRGERFTPARMKQEEEQKAQQ
jgi:transposase